jgi:hypothetical protein
MTKTPLMLMALNLLVLRRLLSKMWIRTRAIVVLDGIYLKWEAGEGENLS